MTQDQKSERIDLAEELNGKSLWEAIEYLESISERIEKLEPTSIIDFESSYSSYDEYSSGHLWLDITRNKTAEDIAEEKAAEEKRKAEMEAYYKQNQQREYNIYLSLKSKYEGAKVE